MRRTVRGFTIIEAVFAVAIAGFVSVGVLLMTDEHLRAAAKEGPAIIATELAQTRLALLQLVPAHVLRSLPDSLAAGTELFPSGAYYWQAAAQPVDGEPGLYELSVSVTGPGEPFRLTTYLFRPDF